MNRVVRLKPQVEVDQEAAVWTWRLDAGGLSAGERVELEGWLRQDARHRRALREFSSTWRSLDRLAEVGRSEKIATLARATRRWSARRPVPRRWAAAAAACLLAIGTAWWLGHSAHTQEFSTAIGQVRTVTLADGTVVALNTNTRIEVRLLRDRRDIYLLKGEAHFHDTHDPARPFFVHAGNTRVQAIGTRFEVRLHADRRIDVLVNEGLVEVRAERAQPWRFYPFEQPPGMQQVRSLRAGERLSINGAHIEVASVSSHQIVDDLAWRHGSLVFDDEPLAQAVTEVARYTHAHILLGPGVGTLRISGRFRTKDVPGFFKALAMALPVRVTHSGPDQITVQPAQPPRP